MSNLIFALKRSRWGGRLAVLMTTLIVALMPAFAFAGEANVTLKFSNTDRYFLIASLVIGAISVIAAFMFRAQIMGQSKGSEAMQEVGQAIREGALAYLQQQGKLMLIFIFVLAALLFVMYNGSYGPTVALLTVVCFVLGVGASYLAGYVGMDSAVNANMRTAHAALTSYKKALETAFRSGAVAGLMTVGMGLIGATLIFLLFPENATKLLVGFGFGGSLAALFMRVGGGIYTKAADVGADLVGKVEAGIPEDDPRNAAVIADNVGDNVGDCAGMAADVFESYEVTLVAAIVLGAATAMIFDQSTWMKLIMFALMARGVGIIASIIGVVMVKGSDSLSSDPLVSIRKGFFGSAAFATVATAVLAFLMMGGSGGVGQVKTSQLVTAQMQNYRQFMTIRDAALKVSRDQKKDIKKVTTNDIKENGDVKSMKLEDQAIDAMVAQVASFKPEKVAEPKAPTDVAEIDATDPKSKAGSLAVFVQSVKPGGDPVVDSLYNYYKSGGTSVYEFEITQTTNPPADQKDAQPEVRKQKIMAGPFTQQAVDDLLAQSKPEARIEKTAGPFPVKFYSTSDGSNLYMAVDPQDRSAVDLTKIQSVLQTFPDATTAAVKDYMNKVKADNKAAGDMPTQGTVTVAILSHTTVPWWTFFVCVFFGIMMAFAFEQITDYYVSLHKKPVTELGAVATAGPAPMIINGFAYGQESAVFSVLAIVVALIVPLIVFPVSTYGSYIMSFYGIALVGLGLLTTTGFILAMDTFGPISDNAQGVYEMSGAGHDNADGARRVQLLDAAGNTTKALTKGFAIATAVVAAVALFHAYVEEGKLTAVGMRLEVPEIFLGLLIGAAVPYLFSAFAIKAVGRAAVELISEVRSQFRNDPGIMAGTSKPNYAKCVAIVTSAAQKELLGPGILAIAFPVAVAFGFAIGKPTTTIGGQEYNLVGAQALGGYLAGAIVSGQLLAVMLANSGGMWDNAKKLIEDGLHGGKGTEAHKAAVVCDTVGDPFKDTAGPALNPLIKVMNLVALLMVPMVIRPWPTQVQVGITVSAIALLVLAIWMSNRGGMADTFGKEPPVDAAGSTPTEG